MQTIKNIIFLLGSTSAALDRSFAMMDAMCPGVDWKDEGEGYKYFEVNGDHYDPNSVRGQLVTRDPKDYDLNCMRFCLAMLDPTKSNNCCGWYP